MKKGIIFALDAAVAVFVVVIILINSSYYFSTSTRESISNLQLVKVGNDVLSILDITQDLDIAVFNDTLKSPGTARIELSDLNYTKYLPQNYDMRIEISDLNESVINSTAISCAGSVCNCDAYGCNGSAIFNSLPVVIPGNYLVAIYLTVNTFDQNDTVYIWINGVLVRKMGPGGQPNYKKGSIVAVPIAPLPFAAGVNIINLTSNNCIKSTWECNHTIHWFRILGERSYYGSSGNSLPNNTFIGTGERVFTVESKSSLDNLNVARFYTWLK